MKKVLSFLLLCMLLTSLPVYAESTRVDIKVLDFRYFSISEEKIIGSFEIENTTNFHEEDLFYTISLIPDEVLRENGDNFASALALKCLEPVNFALSSYEKKTIAFEYLLPDNIYDGTYTLMLNFSDKTTAFPTNATVNKITLKRTTTNFLIASDYSNTHYYDIPNNTYPLSGPGFNVGTSPEAVINLKSTFKKEVIAYPKFTIYKRQQSFHPEPVKDVTGDAITFSPLNKKIVKLNLPQLDEPDSYLVKVIFVNDIDIPISYEYYFRYVVNGASAKIAYISTAYLNETKELQTNISFFGSADGSILENTTFSYEVSEGSTGRVIYKAEVPLTLYSVPYQLGKTDLLESKGIPINIKAKIIYKDKILAYENITLNKKATEEAIEPSLKDVEGLTCERSVKMLHALGIISNYPDGNFKPDVTITRAEMASIALKLKGTDKYIQGGSNLFSDVPDTHWASQIINTASGEDIISGYGDGTFRPNNNVTYAEALTMILNATGFKDAATSMSDSWPINYIAFASQTKLLKDVPITSFNIPATRDKIAVITLAMYIIERM